MPLPNLSLKCQPKCSLICVSRSALIVAACAAAAVVAVVVVVIVWLHYYCSVAAACGVCAQSLIMNSARLALAAAHASCQLDTASHTSLLSLSLSPPAVIHNWRHNFAAFGMCLATSRLLPLLLHSSPCVSCHSGCLRKNLFPVVL